MDLIGRVLRGALDKSKYVGAFLAVIMGMLIWWQYATYHTATWCPTANLHTVGVGETWESLASIKGLPVRTLKMCNWNMPEKGTIPLSPEDRIWLPRISVMTIFIIAIWISLQSFNMYAIVSVMLLYTMVMVFLFGQTFSFCPGSTSTLMEGKTIWQNTGGKVWGAIICNIRLWGADFTTLQPGFQFRNPNNIFTGAVVVLLSIALYKLLSKDR